MTVKNTVHYQPRKTSVLNTLVCHYPRIFEAYIVIIVDTVLQVQANYGSVP
jgi:hypothetical protein